MLVLVPRLRSSPFISIISGLPSREAGSRALGCRQDQGWEGSRGRLRGDCPFPPRGGGGHISCLPRGEANSPRVPVAHQMRWGQHPPPTPASESVTSIASTTFVRLFCPSPFFRGAYWQVAVTKSPCPFISESRIALEKRHRNFPGKWENIFVSETRPLKMPQRVSGDLGWSIAPGSLAETIGQHRSIQGRSCGLAARSHRSPPLCRAQHPPLLLPQSSFVLQSLSTCLTSYES